ncbi:HD domain-containing protein [Reyranella massiliensis]|uniref:HD domain-containing protein n=1 Tax=Reyranella massiliensis TaxID=445220 RepID=UPI0003102B74|nr:HD domain-containing protein [Reyranella massiliensis]
MSDPLRQELLDIFVGRATRRYGLSEINQLQHALQSAALAEADNAPPATVLAALLHDVGHMIHELGEDPASRGVDDVHEALGADWLAKRFGPDVSEPVRLHVTAKRYLCTVESDYFGKLAPDSVRSLKLQGGLMSPDEVEAFRANPHHAEAVRLRRYDEEAKDPHACTPDFDHYLRHVPACRRP